MHKDNDAKMMWFQNILNRNIQYIVLLYEFQKALFIKIKQNSNV